MKAKKKAAPVVPAKRKKAKEKPAADAFARTRITAAVPAGPFGKLRALLLELDGWDGSLAKIPDGAFCFSLNRELFDVAAKSRIWKRPTLREAVAWFSRKHKSVEAEVILERAGRKLMRAFSDAPLIARLVNSVREEDDLCSLDLLRLLGRLDAKTNLNPFRQTLAPSVKESLLAAGWRARAEYAEWLLSFTDRHVWFGGPTYDLVFLSVHDSWLWMLLRHDGLFGESSIVESKLEHVRRLARYRKRQQRTRQMKS